MKFKDYIMSQEWNNFSRYPSQGTSIYLKCFTENGSDKCLIRIDNFNASIFSPDKILEGERKRKKWKFLWLPADEIDENYNKLTEKGEM